MSKPTMLLAMVLFSLPLQVMSQSLQVRGAEDPRPRVDGTLEPGEWAQASRLPLKGGQSVYVWLGEDTLYLAIKGAAGGFTSLALGNHQKIRILHASTGLITAAYEKQEGYWFLKHDFREPLTKEKQNFGRGDIRFSTTYRQAQLDQFNWYANLVDMGEASETEYLIPLSALPEGELYLSVVFYQFKAKPKKAVLPATLSDGCLNQGLISGSARDGLQFEPGQWWKLR